MSKHLYFIVNLQDAVRLSQELKQAGISHYHIEPHDQNVSFIFPHVSDFHHVELRSIFSADGETQ